MNPMNVNRARTARLASQDVRPVVYTSETGVPTQREREEVEQRARWADSPARGGEECPCGDC